MDIRRIMGGQLEQIQNDASKEAAELKKAQAAGMPATDALETSSQQADAMRMQNLKMMMAALTSADGTTRLPGVEDPGGMPYLDQGSSNGCGTTSLAMIMSYLGVPMTQDQIDGVIRQADIFTSPNDIIEFARDHGLECEGYNNGSWNELKSHIDQGHPCQVLINADYSYPDGSSIDGLHYVAVTGYETDNSTNPPTEFVLCHDPNYGSEMRIPRDQFEKMWGDVGFGFDNYFMAMAPGGTTLPPGRDEGIEGTLGALDGLTNITNGWNNIFSADDVGDVVHGIFQIPGGIIGGIGSAVGAGISIAGQWMYDGVEGIPVLENIVQPFAGLVDTAGAVIGDIFNGFGEAFDDVGVAFDSLLDGDVGGFFGGLGDAIVDVGGGVVDAVVDVVEGVGEAIGDFFSGW